jgi:7,8-dihydro-6-hydroxymethylpterin dimethyltransferase
MEKHCPFCGDLEKVLIWKNTPKTYYEWRRECGGTTHVADQRAIESSNNCPFECGLCPKHRQETCTAIIEVTSRCNISCPVCFADAGKSSDPDPDLAHISQMMQTVLDRSGPHPIQLSGGEPTIRNDLPQIVAIASKMEFSHIQVNTNGIRLAQEKNYAKTLKDSGATAVFLQFDGISDDVYRRLRGADLFSLKLKAIENCAEAKIGVILVPTLVKNVNMHQIGAIIQFAKKWIPIVKGVHFQPMAYLGRHPDAPRNEDRILIPEILQAIEEQTGELKVENFVPPG